jgi:hypothetical protein
MPATITSSRDDDRLQLEKITDAADEINKAVKRLWRSFDKKYGDADIEPYLDSDGKFTDAGVKRLYGYLAEGKSNSELSEYFGVTDSAIIYRRKRWMQLEASKDVRPRRR